MRLVTITDVEGLAALEPAWWELWRRCEATPFLSPAWLLAWWRHFAPGSLQSSAAFQGSRLVGLFPFYLDETGGRRRLLPVGISLSDYLDVLVDPDFPEACDALAERMLATPWDVWEFAELAPDAMARRLACPAQCTETGDNQSACPVLDIAAGDLSACVPGRRRRQLRHARAFAARCASSTIHQVESAERFLDSLFALHAARWHSRGEPGLLCDERVQRFHRAALPGLAAAGLSRCYTLTIDERVVGAYYGFADRRSAYAYMGGFDPRYEEASPGAILIGHAIEEAIRESAQEFHFLRGREAYKYSWGARDRYNLRRCWERALLHA